jgi:hypothetical protein
MKDWESMDRRVGAAPRDIEIHAVPRASTVWSMGLIVEISQRWSRIKVDMPFREIHANHG